MESVPDLFESATTTACAVIVPAPHAYASDTILERTPLIVDTRNALGKAGKDDARVVRL